MARGRIALVLAAAGLLLSACADFVPLYAQPGVTPSLQSVEVTTPQNRVGFLLREQLNDQLARKLDEPARYRLTLTADEQRSARGLRVNNVASDFELDLRVNYQLIENGTGKVLTAGAAPVTVFYVSADAPYAGIAAQQDAQERAANQVAILIRLELSRYFNRLAQGAAQAEAANP
jgi:LPS-assembly lipoprotein